MLSGPEALAVFNFLIVCLISVFDDRLRFIFSSFYFIQIVLLGNIIDTRCKTNELFIRRILTAIRDSLERIVYDMYC